jgi:hypothetical protein
MCTKDKINQRSNLSIEFLRLHFTFHLFIVYIMMLPISHGVLCQIIKLCINNDLEVMWKEVFVTLFEVLSKHV